ncbi:MAG TPA: aldehyde dehydrogenase family protein, partial [Phenylobacterium sp.]|nr:aldehyde dehydrogenase family protein [Phenylobacterium sp.]
RTLIVDKMAGLKVGVSSDPQAQYGPVVSAAHRRRVSDYIALGVAEGAELVVDGRDFRLQGHENGFFLGPSLFDHVRP